MSRTNIVRTSILALLIVVLLIVGVLWYLRSSDNEEPKSLAVIPQLGGRSLIQFNPTDRESIKAVTLAIEDALRPYNESNANVYKGCNFYNPAPLGKTCDVDLSQTAFGSCTKANAFGYRKSSPCVFLKLSRKPDWVPIFYNETKLPESMPDFLKKDIQDYVKTTPRNAQMIWVSCEGKTAEDNQKIGPITYYPRRGFPGFYFPCTSEDRCTQPLVAVYFERPTTQTPINVQCKIWAQNLEETINFELLIE